MVKKKEKIVVSEKPNNKIIVEAVENKEDVSNEDLLLTDTEVYDEGDIASAIEQGFLARALAKQKEKMLPETHPDFDGKHCLDCDVDIPKQRLAMGKIRCVDCQTLLEEDLKRKNR